MGVKKVRSNPTYVQPKVFISADHEAKKSPTKDVSNYLSDIATMIAYFHKYDWFCHLATFIIILVQKRWPSDKANRTCENML